MKKLIEDIEFNFEDDQKLIGIVLEDKQNYSFLFKQLKPSKAGGVSSFSPPATSLK